jgi:hypothetical protein
MLAEFNENDKFKVPHYRVGDEVLAFSHISGKFFRGKIGQINTYTDINQNAINYTVMIDETKGVPNVPEALVFDKTSDAYKWTKDVQEELANV